MRFKHLLLGSVLFITLQGCSYFQQDPQTEHATYCKELKYRIVNYSYVLTNKDNVGSQGPSPGQWQQSAEMQRLQQSYHSRGCD